MGATEDFAVVASDPWLLFLVDQFDGREWNVPYHSLPGWLRTVLEKPHFNYRDRFMVTLFLCANGVNPYHWVEAVRARVNADGHAHILSLLGDLGIKRNAYGNWIPSFSAKPGFLTYKVWVTPPRRLSALGGRPRFADDPWADEPWWTLAQLGYSAASF
jgi:hypothetical protein